MVVPIVVPSSSDLKYSTTQVPRMRSSPPPLPRIWFRQLNALPTRLSVPVTASMDLDWAVLPLLDRLVGSDEPLANEEITRIVGARSIQGIGSALRPTGVTLRRASGLMRRCATVPCVGGSTLGKTKHGSPFRTGMGKIRSCPSPDGRGHRHRPVPDDVRPCLRGDLEGAATAAHRCDPAGRGGTVAEGFMGGRRPAAWHTVEPGRCFRYVNWISARAEWKARRSTPPLRMRLRCWYDVEIELPGSRRMVLHEEGRRGESRGLPPGHPVRVRRIRMPRKQPRPMSPT